MEHKVANIVMRLLEKTFATRWGSVKLLVATVTFATAYLFVPTLVLLPISSEMGLVAFALVLSVGSVPVVDLVGRRLVARVPRLALRELTPALTAYHARWRYADQIDSPIELKEPILEAQLKRLGIRLPNRNLHEVHVKLLTLIEMAELGQAHEARRRFPVAPAPGRKRNPPGADDGQRTGLNDADGDAGRPTNSR